MSDDAALWVAADGRNAPLRVPLSDTRRALWTARVATLKDALLAALRGSAPQQQQKHVVLAVVACARCGRPSGCRCGWRRVHEIPVALEARSLAQLLPRLLPLQSHGDGQAAPPQSLHARLYESRQPPAPWLETTVAQVKVVDPMVERLRAVFRVDVRFGDKSWSVSRRFQEFATLHAALATSADPKLLPPLPPRTWFRRLDDGFLLGRKRALDQYLCCLLLIDCVRDSVALLSFLGAISTAHETLLQPAADSLCSTQVLHLRVLQYYVRAGDVLLFKSRGVVSSLLRSVTGSEWDHVAVVVPRARDDDRKGFLLLEATGDGVTALSLTSRLYAYSIYHTSRIALRQLQTPLLTDAVRGELLERFTARVQGCAYGLSVSKVLRTNEQRRSSRDRPDLAGLGNDFFCSELIADAYKALGLIGETIPSSNFWPSSFASGAFVDVEIGRHGATLDSAIAVDCLMLEVATAHKA